ncbi:OLC1v1032405C1 [Oldenlandia corymbosa var. corymbosa]|uniref:ascorbate ferrireductase (transmembrane) n=1 Tax=Oldenlandia corymbosa var. corymbosa TaxID=529605 RepID=A0AAV1CLQ0_OLDCO|nr:OLC1v1032405C1 [Oldenlandia corymbosa var. corymbosa]
MVSVSLFSSPSLLLTARFSAFIVAALVLIWALRFKNSFTPRSSSQEDLIYAVLHPLSMVIGFIVVSGEAILVHRWLPGSSNRKKSVHLSLQGFALGSGIFGIWSKFHSNDGIVANFYSLHSWMGLFCITLFGAQWILGFLSFWHKGEVRGTRVRVLPWHVFVGLYTYALAVITAETGLLEKLTFLQTRGDVMKRSTESMVVNGLGLGLALLSGIVILAAISPKHKPLIIPRNHPGNLRISASIAKKDQGISWVSTELKGPDDYNGWAVVETPTQLKKRRKEGAIVMICIGATALLGVIAFFSLSRKGFKFQFSAPFSRLGSVLPYQTEGNGIAIEIAESEVLQDKAETSEDYLEDVSDTVKQNVLKEPKHNLQGARQLGRIRVPVAADSTQQEALRLLKKLKIIEDSVTEDELCTRREYARWLIRANSQLERSQRHRIVSAAALSGSAVAAFDDVNVNDPDFVQIQCLAEAGIVASKLLDGSTSSDKKDSDGEPVACFSPERFISRQDLISWKAKLEYGVMQGINKEVSTKNIPFLDSRDISSEAVIDLFTDTLADEKSILRRVFGQIKRLQPRKPSTKAQAAVALTSGRMADFIHAELSRLEAENASKETAKLEIKSELLDRGIIRRFWERKIEEERNHGLEIEKDYLDAIHDLEQEKAIQESGLAEILKQKAALDCQKQLLSSLKLEVQEMSEHLEVERANFINERNSLEGVLQDLQLKHEGLLDAKSILEAEIEALRILRSWVDDEARKSQARAKVLGDAGKRWRWDKKS